MVGENEFSISAIQFTKDLGAVMTADYRWAGQCKVVAEKQDVLQVAVCCTLWVFGGIHPSAQDSQAILRYYIEARTPFLKMISLASRVYSGWQLKCLKDREEYRIQEG